MRTKSALELDIKPGDILLGGRFKNKKIVVKSVGTNDLGQPTYNGGKPLLAVRVLKAYPKGHEVVNRHKKS